jgi:hypothetical protein
VDLKDGLDAWGNTVSGIGEVRFEVEVESAEHCELVAQWRRKRLLRGGPADSKLGIHTSRYWSISVQSAIRRKTDLSKKEARVKTTPGTDYVSFGLTTRRQLLRSILWVGLVSPARRNSLG